MIGLGVLLELMAGVIGFKGRASHPCTKSLLRLESVDNF